MTASSSSSSSSPAITSAVKVFINFRGDELRDNFISHLDTAFRKGGINHFIDNQLVPSDDLESLFKHIEESRLALAVFSKRYSESKWCLNELVKIMEMVEEDNIKVIPIFFKVTVDDVKHQRGEFGTNLYGLDRSNMPLWEKALKSVPHKKGLRSSDYRTESEFVDDILSAVNKVIDTLSPVSLGRGQQTNLLCTSISTVRSECISLSGTIQQTRMEPPIYGIEQRLKQLEEKLSNFKCPQRRVVGIVGMPGIGKTTLASTYYARRSNEFIFNRYIPGENSNSNTNRSDWLKKELLNGQDLNDKAEMFTKKIFVVFDDVSLDQVNFLVQHLKWIKDGSKIVVTTRDKSLIAGLVDDTYVVSGLNDKEALQLFDHHASGNFPELSKKFVEYADGNPWALEELGKEVCGKEEAYWEERVETLPHCCNKTILADLQISYNKLTTPQQDAFLDIACFFRSEDEDHVKCLLDTHSSHFGAPVRDLAEKFLVQISAGRIEMHNLLCTLGKELGSSAHNDAGERMWNHEKAIDILRSEHVKKGTNKVRGIFLDTSKITTGIPLDTNTFVERFDQRNLRYLKIYDSLCPQQCEVDCKVNLPEGLEFPFEKIRYLHWLKFPLDELPSDFNPKNLIDLRLPYSTIKRVWKEAKEALQLKWVDLSYSTKLFNLSALSKAFYLRRLNLEGCTKLSTLPTEMKNMKSLVFLNLRGCVELSALPKNLDLVSLKTLILSGCSKFNNFELKSANLESLHLDGTAIKTLPPSIHKFEKLVILNLKECQMLESLPCSLGKLKALEELILSGCVKLVAFPNIKENMENLQILLLDGTSIEEVPNVLLHATKSKGQVIRQQPLVRRMNGVSLLRRLCLRGNQKIFSLELCFNQLYHLKWIDLRYCKNLQSISTLPPNLHCLDAHDCISLKTVSSPLALLMPTQQQVPASFIFTNCEKLEHIAKNDIICYAHNKSRLLSEGLNRHNKGFAFKDLVATLFPGSEVPAWFCHIAYGAKLELELPRHWSESGFAGLALCAVVSFGNQKIRNSDLQVKCTLELSETTSSGDEMETDASSSNQKVSFTFHIGGLSERDEKECTIKSTHVFIGYTNWLDMKKCQEEDARKGCIPTMASINFEVTDDSDNVMNCEVLKCGFSLVYESASWETSSETEYIRQDESMLFSFCRRINWLSKLWGNRNKG